MKWSWFGRAALALLSAVALGLGMTACGGGTIAYLWTVGQQYDQIHGYKVDQYTGNLTAVQNSPFSANGAVPVDILVKPGGRYVYVVNQGTACTTTTSSNTSCTSSTSDAQDSGIAVFAVGGDGALTYQQSYPTQGHKHLWAQFDSTGNFLFVLDQYSPSGDGNGAITTFTVDPNTGRLSLDLQTSSVPAGVTAPTYLEVGRNPLRTLATSSCVLTLNQADQTVTEYGVANGQLTPATTATYPLGTTHATSIGGNATYVVVTDAGGTNSAGAYDTPGTIFPFTVGNGCALNPFTGGNGFANTATAVDPVYAFLDASNKYLFVLNQASTNTNSTTSNSSITAYNILTTPTQQLAFVPGQPFPSGSGPVCMVEDPQSRFMYVSNSDGTITGYDFDNTEGTLSNLARGSSFNTNDTGLQCIALSGSVD